MYPVYPEVAFRTKRRLPDNDDAGSSEPKGIPTGRQLVDQRDRKTLGVGAHDAPGVMVHCASNELGFVEVALRSDLSA